VRFHGDGGNFPQFFHLVNNKGDHSEVKLAGGRVEMESQFISILESDMKLELIQVDCYGVGFGIFSHFFISSILLKTKEILAGPEITKKI
jgi:hypothetical protein